MHLRNQKNQKKMNNSKAENQQLTRLLKEGGFGKNEDVFNTLKYIQGQLNEGECGYEEITKYMDLVSPNVQHHVSDIPDQKVFALLTESLFNVYISVGKEYTGFAMRLRQIKDDYKDPAN